MQISTEELPAFIAVLIAGKFRVDADKEIAASPIVAAIAHRAVAALAEHQISKYGAGSEKHTLVWRDFKNHEEEWRFACRYAADLFGPDWNSWSVEKQRRVVDDLVSPFLLSDEGRLAFVEAFLAVQTNGAETDPNR